jgi:hypothetical protein
MTMSLGLDVFLCFYLLADVFGAEEHGNDTGGNFRPTSRYLNVCKSTNQDGNRYTLIY